MGKELVIAADETEPPDVGANTTLHAPRGGRRLHPSTSTNTRRNRVREGPKDSNSYVARCRATRYLQGKPFVRDRRRLAFVSLARRGRRGSLDRLRHHAVKHFSSSGAARNAFTKLPSGQIEAKWWTRP